MFGKVYPYLLAKKKQDKRYSSGFLSGIIRRKALLFCEKLKGRILEVGSGDGSFLALLGRANPGIELWGIDLDREKIVLCEERLSEDKLNNIKVLCQDAAHLQFEEGYFDAIICINFIMNLGSLEEVRRVLAQMLKVCKAKGKLILEFRSSGNPFQRLKFCLAKHYDETVRHYILKTYSPDEIEDTLKGFNLKVSRRIFTGPIFKKFAFSIIIEAQKIC